MRCTAKVKDGADPLAQMRAAQPMPRGERLYAARHATPRKPPHRMLGVFDPTRRKELGDAFYADNIRVYAAPLALARERRRRERAERIAEERRVALFQAWADEQATSAAFHERGREIEKLNASAASRQAENRDLRAERDALRAEVARLQPAPEQEVAGADLAPCPFCRGRAVLIAGERLNEDEQYHWVRCTQCAAEGPWTKNRGGACRKWNEAQPQPITGDTSDGYHTFNELYAHRIALWKAVCRLSGGAWRSKKHSDGSGIPGWFVLGMGREPGRQCTYHLSDAEWDACAFAETLDTAPTFDGHTPADVLARIDGLQPPTREEVERAVAEVEDSYDALIDAPALDAYRVPAVLALIHSEVSEALEAFRKDDRDNFAEELADVVIRTLDCAGGLGIDLEKAVLAKLEKNRGRGFRHGGKRV